MIRTLLRLFVLVATVFCVTALGAEVALAHNKQMSSSPADGEILSSSPNVWAVTFDKAVPIDSASGEIVKSDGVRVALSQPRHGQSNKIVVFDLPANLSGSVTARWRLIGTDGHVISGRVSFSVNAPSITTTTTPGSTSVPMSVNSADTFSEGRISAPEPVRVALRLLNYLALVLLMGALFTEWYLARGALTIPMGRRFASIGSFGLPITSLLQLVVFVDDVKKSGGSWVSGFADAVATTPGAMLLMKTATGALLVVMVGQLLRSETFYSAQTASTNAISTNAISTNAISTNAASTNALPTDRARTRLIGATMLVYLVTLAYGGHSRSMAAPWLGIPVHMVHTATAAIWFGGLAALLFIIIPQLSPERCVVAFDRFGYAAERAVAILVGTGIIQTFRLHPNPISLFTNSHGLLLTAKIVLVAFMLRLAAQNRQMLLRKRQQTGNTRMLHRLLVKASLVETTTGVAVLTITAVLVAATP